jgi:AbrB family looped-hinge helix DNA binding protein
VLSGLDKTLKNLIPKPRTTTAKLINPKILLSYNRKIYKMELLKLSAKGQIVIPQEMREELEMREGTIIALERAKNMIVIKKVDTELVDKIKRSLEDIRHGRIREWKG